jgi:hypothetical protein
MHNRKHCKEQMSMLGAPISGVSTAFGAAAALGPIDSLLAAFNTNPYFIGLMMLILNLGGRFLAMEVTKGQEYFLSHPIVRRTLIFVVLFIATRNIVIAFWLWLAIIVLLGYLFNENSALCVLGRRGLPGSSCAKMHGPEPAKPTDQEMSIYKMLSDKVKTFEAFQNQAETDAAATAAQDKQNESAAEEDTTAAATEISRVPAAPAGTRVIGNTKATVLESPPPATAPTFNSGALAVAISNQTKKAQADPMVA